MGQKMHQRLREWFQAERVVTMALEAKQVIENAIGEAYGEGQFISGQHLIDLDYNERGKCWVINVRHISDPDATPDFVLSAADVVDQADGAETNGTQKPEGGAL